MSEVAPDIQRARNLYETARAAKTGDAIVCPVCNTTFGKVNYQQAFCSNNGPANCKDRYWNLIADRPARGAFRKVTPTTKFTDRLAKAEHFIEGAIEEARANGLKRDESKLRALHELMKGILDE